MISFWQTVVSVGTPRLRGGHVFDGGSSMAAAG
jgi:hypothetical protein